MRDCDKAQTIERQRKEQKQAEKRCFWSWPWGHCYCTNYSNNESVPYWQIRCCHCGKKAYA